MRTFTIKRALLAASILSSFTLAASPAVAGRGSSPGALRSAVASGGVDAITTELERAESLVCAACVDIVRPLVDHPSDKVREAAGWWLARRGVRPGVLTDMVARLGGSDPVAARNAADVLRGLSMEDSVAPLGAALGRTALGAEARVAVARALGAIGNPDAQPALVAAFGDGEATVRAASLAALRNLRGFANGAVVVPLLGDLDPRVRTEAILTIGGVKARVGVSELVGIVLLDADPAVRRKAAWALGEIGAPAALAGSALQKAATGDANPLVRSIAQAAISHLTR